MTVQGHVVYNVAPSLWLAADATHYVGGRTTVGSIRNDDRQEATRIGLTLSLPIFDGLSVKLAWSDTATTRLPNSGFTTYPVALQLTFFDR